MGKVAGINSLCLMTIKHLNGKLSTFMEFNGGIHLRVIDCNYGQLV